MHPTRLDVRHALLCGLAALIVIAITWPKGDTPIADDWSYGYTARQLAQTGHVAYTGGTSAPALSQAVYAVPWIKGAFSFQRLRLSMIPLAAMAVAVTFLLGRRAGLSGPWSAFAAALLGTSPVFLPLATSFMTDVPTVLCLLGSAYAAVAAAEAASRGRAFGWVGAAVAIGIVGGLDREAAWVAPLLLLPYAAWVRRSDKPFLVAAAAGWALTLAVAIAVGGWYGRQPFAVPEPSLVPNGTLVTEQPLVAFGRWGAIGMTAVLLVLPATVGLATRRPGGSGRAPPFVVSGVLLAGLIAACALIGVGGWFPWMGSLLTAQGTLSRLELAGVAPRVLAFPVCVGLSVLALAAVSLAVGWVVRGSAAVAAGRFVARPADGRLAGPALLLLGVGVLVLLLVRATVEAPADAGLLVLIPCLSIPLLAAFPPAGRAGVAVAWSALAVFGLYGVAATQEELARNRAIAVAVDRLRQGGAADQTIDGGYEFDSWTEVTTDGRGHVNAARAVGPAGTYDEFQGPWPHLVTGYELAYTPQRDSVPTAGGTVDYPSLLPPFHRQVYLRKLNRRVEMPGGISGGRAAKR